jgi:diguanylate cyclase (GGDEF)-like protein
MTARRDAIAGERALAARVCGAMMLAGAGLGAISVVLPPRAANSDSIILILAMIGAVLGGILFASRTTLPEWLLGLAIATGTALVTAATFQGGADHTGTEDNEMMYVWICLLAFNFLRLRHALLQLVLIAAAYPLLLTELSVGEAATRWLVSMTTLLVAGLVVYRLRASREVLIAKLSRRARNDSLTGLLNRHGLEERAARELARARRDGTALSLIVLDIDGFKEINDTLGHPAGDEILCSVARGIERETREIDSVARLGGDEFAILLPGALGTDAMVVALRLVRAGGEGEGSWPSVSMGIATTTGGEHAFEKLWHDADAAMYEAKRSGGGAVQVAPPSRRLAAAG